MLFAPTHDHPRQSAHRENRVSLKLPRNDNFAGLIWRKSLLKFSVSSRLDGRRMAPPPPEPPLGG